MTNKFNLKDEWYFIKQDIVSYSISTVLYVGLCVISTYTIQTLIYALFECFVFYVSFWFIRVHFDLTYHANVWSVCKFWTRTMLCTGVTLLWLMPIEYSLFNSLFVAVICCWILYLVAYKTMKNIYAMDKDELYEHCRKRGLDDVECKIAYYIVFERLKGKELYDAIGYSERQTIRKRKEILSKIK